MSSNVSAMPFNINDLADLSSKTLLEQRDILISFLTLGQASENSDVDLALAKLFGIIPNNINIIILYERGMTGHHVCSYKSKTREITNRYIIPCYTADEAAARKLIPQHYTFELKSTLDGKFYCQAMRYPDREKDEVAKYNAGYIILEDANGWNFATPALAYCAVALQLLQHV